MQYVSSTPATRLDVINLQEKLDQQLQQRQVGMTIVHGTKACAGVPSAPLHEAHPGVLTLARVRRPVRRASAPFARSCTPRPSMSSSGKSQSTARSVACCSYECATSYA